MISKELKHAAKTKTQIRDVLHHYLYRPVLLKLERELDAIIVANNQIIRSSYECFMYRNELYKKSTFKGLPPRPSNRLDKSLFERMDKYIDTVGDLNQYEMPYVMGFVNQVLNSSDDLMDYLRVFPKLLHSPLQEMIDSCPCKNTKLAPETVADMQHRNHENIELIKQRLAYNLLLQ